MDLVNMLTYPVGAFEVWHILLALTLGGFWIWYEKVESDALYSEYLREEEQRERLERIRSYREEE